MLVAAALAAAGCSGEPDARPDLQPAVLPVIDRHLEENPDFRGMLADRDSTWFCSEHVIEIREQPGKLLVGLMATCDEYVELDGALGAGSGYRGPKLVTVRDEDGSYAVESVQSAEDGDGYRASVDRMFTEEGAGAVLDHESHELENNTVAAKIAFGLPPDAPVVPGQLAEGQR